VATIDVVIPAYNAAGTISETIDSLRKQTFAGIRIIVVDDGSTDGTPAILAELVREDTRIHVVTKANDGIVEARNDGLRACTAEFIACLDADDTAFPLRLERQLNYLREHPGCVALGGAVEHMDERGATLSGLHQPGPPSAADPARTPAQEPYLVQSTLMMRRSAVEAVGGYRHVPNSEDSDLFWRLADVGELVNLPETLGRYRVHASISSSIVNGRIMAMGSQLGAISTLRRRAGRSDLEFPRALHESMKKAVTLEAMFALASRDLDKDEAERLRVATAGKLMELSRYRPYEPDGVDCAFIRSALPLAQKFGAQSRKEIDWYVAVTAARLVRKGRVAEAFALTPPTHYPVAAIRALAG
jgi:glycosyltransferase involved in cell wall biosynthesis